MPLSQLTSAQPAQASQLSSASSAQPSQLSQLSSKFIVVLKVSRFEPRLEPRFFTVFLRTAPWNSRFAGSAGSAASSLYENSGLGRFAPRFEPRFAATGPRFSVQPWFEQRFEPRFEPRVEPRFKPRFAVPGALASSSARLVQLGWLWQPSAQHSTVNMLVAALRSSFNKENAFCGS